MQRDALMLNAYAEIGTGFFLSVLLFTPVRNFLLLFLYFNFLRMRYYSPDVAAYHQQVGLACKALHAVGMFLIVRDESSR